MASDTNGRPRGSGGVAPRGVTGQLKGTDFVPELSYLTAQNVKGMTTFSLPRREGAKPRTTATNPHTQLDQQPAAADAERLRAVLASLLFALPDVQERPSAISVPGARALWLADAAARGPREAFLIGTEFAHLHPAPDWSLHAALPPSLAQEAIDTGWAEVHPVARLRLIPPNVVMIYAPRDHHEVEIVAELVRRARAFAGLGHGVHPTSS